MPDQPTVTLRKGESSTDVPEDQVQAYIDRGWAPESGDERAESVAHAARVEAQGTAAPILAGIARTATLGGSDVLMRLTGGEDARIGLDQMRQDQSGLSTIGEIAGGFLTPGVGALGGAIREGGGLGRAVAAGAVEGGVYGAGQGVSELALSDDPLTAEHIASTLSSNILTGAGVGGVAGAATHGIQRGLTRANEALDAATSARTALEGVPPELANLDEAGLKSARASAMAEHTADIAAERKSLEEIRVNQRAEVANQVRDLHESLATERPIFQAVTGDDLAKIDGVSDIKVQLAKSYKSLRSGLDSEISVARDPSTVIRPLEMRQAALEKLQDKLPELQAALVGDSRGAALEHVTDALNETKQQIETIRALKSTPVQSGRLTALEANPSAKVQAIDSAREALKKAPELGLLGKGAKAGAFAVGTAAAHMIPGVGIAAPFLGKGASDVVGNLFERLNGGIQKGMQRTSAATKAFLGAVDKATPYVPMVATKTLSAVKFGLGPEAKSDKLADLYKARSQEIRGQTEYAPDGTLQMRQDARMAMAQKLAPIASVNPVLADKVETAAARKIVYMSSKLPKRPDVGGIQIGPDKWQPSEMEMRSWARTVRACEDPHGVEERLAHGVVTPEDADAYRTCYPEKFQAMQMAITQQLPTLTKTLPMKKKVALSVFTGVPMIPPLQPNVQKVLQRNYATEPGTQGGSTAPRPMPAFGALGSPKSMDKPTPSQAREM